MTKFNFVRSLMAGSMLAGLALGMAGCADVVSYATDSRKDGLKNMEDGAYSDAAGSFRNAVRQDPRDYKSYYHLGQCYDKMNSQHQAVQAYRSSLDVMNVTIEGREDKPFRLQVIDGLASSLAKGGNRSFDDAATVGKSRPAEVKFITAKAYRNLGDADMALSNYEQANQLDPNDFAIAKEYGLFLEQTGQGAKAGPVLRRAYAMNDKDVQVADALRRLDVVPGPSLKRREELKQTLIPRGPLPEADLSKIGNILPGGGNKSSDSTTPSPSAAAESPRD